MDTKQDAQMWDFYQSEMNEKEYFSNSTIRLDFVLQKLKKYKQTGKVADLGLGDGYLVKKLSEAGYQTVGLDLSEVNINKLKHRLSPSIEFVVGNINSIPFLDNTFDGITASEIIEHLNDDDMNRGIAEIYRCLKPGGVGVITIPADENLKDKMCYCPHCNMQFHLFGHKQTFSRHRLELLFSKYNFSSLNISKFLDFDKRWPVIQKLKYKIKMSVVNIPLPYFQSFKGRYVVVVIK